MTSTFHTHRGIEEYAALLYYYFARKTDWYSDVLVHRNTAQMALKTVILRDFAQIPMHPYVASHRTRLGFLAFITTILRD